MSLVCPGLPEGKGGASGSFSGSSSFSKLSRYSAPLSSSPDDSPATSGPPRVPASTYRADSLDRGVVPIVARSGGIVQPSARSNATRDEHATLCTSAAARGYTSKREPRSAAPWLEHAVWLYIVCMVCLCMSARCIFVRCRGSARLNLGRGSAVGSRISRAPLPQLPRPMTAGLPAGRTRSADSEGDG